MTHAGRLPQHVCDQGLLARARPGEAPEGQGSAVDHIVLTPSGTWWAFSIHWEYASPIRYCPYCGTDLHIPKS